MGVAVKHRTWQGATAAVGGGASRPALETRGPMAAAVQGSGVATVACGGKAVYARCKEARPPALPPKGLHGRGPGMPGGIRAVVWMGCFG
jgi:hypothetical protein